MWRTGSGRMTPFPSRSEGKARRAHPACRAFFCPPGGAENPPSKKYERNAGKINKKFVEIWENVMKRVKMSDNKFVVNVNKS